MQRAAPTDTAAIAAGIAALAVVWDAGATQRGDGVTIITRGALAFGVCATVHPVLLSRL